MSAGQWVGYPKGAANGSNLVFSRGPSDREAEQAAETIWIHIEVILMNHAVQSRWNEGELLHSFDLSKDRHISARRRIRRIGGLADSVEGLLAFNKFD